jgi:glycosyltransferase involved in cell wall biosynthesis
VRYLAHEENQGGSAARNTGIEAASGTYIAFLDSDDVWHPTKLERQIECLEARDDDWVAVYCDYRMVRRGATRPLRDWLSARLAREPEAREGGSELTPLVVTERFDLGGASTLLVDRETVEAIDGFDESFRRNQDLELLVRLLRNGKLAYVDEVLVEKHQFDSPSVEAVVAGKQRLLEEFPEEVAAAEANGYHVMQAYWYKVGLYSLREGRFREGVSHLSRSGVPGLTEAFELSWAALVGTITNLRTVFAH